jgi:hypothetical protein
MSVTSIPLMYVLLLLVLLIVPSIPGCAVGVPGISSREVVRSRDVKVQDTAVVSLAPRKLLEKVSKKIETSYDNIELVDSLQFRDTAFPEGGWRLKKLLNPETAQRVTKQLNVDYLALIGTLDVSDEEKGFFFPLLVGAISIESKAALSALIVDLHTGEVISKISSEASGTGLILYYVIFIAGAGSEPSYDSISGLANEIGRIVTELTPQGKPRLAILALEQFEVSYDLDDWKRTKSTYKNELALEIVKERADEGDKDAQWFLYQLQPNRRAMQWLCKEADQGDEKARKELGYLYYYGSDRYRKSMNVHVPADLARACMWFHLAGQVEIIEKPKTKEAKAERTAKVMTTQEIEEAKQLVRAWQPGNCEADLAKHMVAGYVKDPALWRLCTAADLGDVTSRDELGRIYFVGSRGVKRDLKLAFMWYRLAESVSGPSRIPGKIMQGFCDKMTPEQRVIAVKLLREWKPGKCEKDLLQRY